MRRFAWFALGLFLVVAATANEAALAAGTTHTWVGMDTTAPRDWKKAKNWSTNKIPQDGDSVSIRGASVIWRR